MSIAVIVIAIIIFWFIYDMKISPRKLKQRFYPSRNSQYTFFNDGHALFADFFQEIEKAQQEIDIMFYIIKKDELGEQFVRALIDKARAGVQVQLLLDWFGCLRAPRYWLSELKKAGGEVRYSKVPKFPHIFQTALIRNHQKIAVIDGQVSYIGGFNVGDEYISKHASLSPWRDYHLKITGDIGEDFKKEFDDMWSGKFTRYTNGDVYVLNNVFAAGGTGDLQLMPYENGAMEKQYLAYIGEAKERILVGSPYFIPTRNIMRALIMAMASGVAVDIIVPHKEDHLFVREAAIPYFRRLIQRGARIYEFQNGFYHSKFIAIDEKFVEIGTGNFNIRSFVTNDEISCRFTNPAAIQELHQKFQIDINDSTVMTLEKLQLSWWQQLKYWPAQVLASYL